MDFTPKSDLKIFQIFLGILELYFQFILYSLYIGGQFHYIRNIFTGKCHIFGNDFIIQ